MANTRAISLNGTICNNGRVLLNPSEKGKKYAYELKHKTAITNDGHFKLDKNGKKIKLTKEQLAYRSGYLTHSSDSCKCYNALNKKNKR